MSTKGRLHIATLFLTVMAFFAIVSVLPSPLTRSVYADQNVVLTLVASDYSVNPGDIVTVNVFANQLDHVTRFGPIDLRCNSDMVEFVSISQPIELANFNYTTDTSEPGHFVVSAVDEVVESDISSGEDTSMLYESDIILFSVSFRIGAEASGGIRFWLDSADGFRNSSMEEYSAAIGDGITVNVEGTVSDDSDLIELQITGTTLTPDFSSDVYEYSCSVGNSIGDVEVIATARNNGASVEITGDSYLQPGQNVITVDVIAENGISMSTYTIYVTRQGSFFAEELRWKTVTVEATLLSRLLRLMTFRKGSCPVRGPSTDTMFPYLPRKVS